MGKNDFAIGHPSRTIDGTVFAIMGEARNAREAETLAEEVAKATGQKPAVRRAGKIFQILVPAAREGKSRREP